MAERARIRRFGLAERTAHWLVAVTTVVMTVSGLALYLPSLADYVARPLAKQVHLGAAIALGAGLVALLLVANRRELRRTARQLDRFDRYDREWLLGGPGRLMERLPSPPQGRFNAGQKLNAAISAGLLVVLAVTGTLLWLGERNTSFRLDGSVIVHDWASLLLGLLVLGHVYLAVLHPTTRHALRGMTTGEVDREWARKHHPLWVAEQEEEAAGR